jgi:hypothetical protein
MDYTIYEHALGAAKPVRHFHRFTLSPNGLPSRQRRFAVGRTKLLLPLERRHGNLMIATE